MKNYYYPVIILAGVVTAYFFPEYFIQAGDFKFSRLIIPLLQVIMFGMGTTMTFRDFSEIIKTPGKVIVGLLCQFIIMPSLALLIVKVFDFPNEIAAGIILIGSSPSGLASNVIALIARANVPLSITITTFATLAAPVMTPLLMKMLGGEYIEVDFWAMVIETLKIIIIPLGIGFLINRYLKQFAVRFEKLLPLISFAGIAFILIIITATGQKSLSTVGYSLIFAVLLHNLGGFFFGYWSARLCRFPEQDCRTIAIEVGLQNGGLASGLALKMGKLATVGLAPALFGPIMNITGSLLGSWWGKRPPENESEH